LLAQSEQLFMNLMEKYGKGIVMAEKKLDDCPMLDPFVWLKYWVPQKNLFRTIKNLTSHN